MNRGFKLIYDRMQENNPTGQQSHTSAEPSSIALEDYYAEIGHGRNICVVWRDGKRIFLNYSYMVSCEYSPGADTITLSFTTHVFILTGVNLESLYYDLMNQLAKQITCMDKRYNLIGEGEKYVVNDIQTKDV